MKRVIAVITTLLFFMVPTFLLAEGTDGSQTMGKDSSVKAETVKKASKSKKKVKKVTKKAKPSRKKAKKTVKQAEPMKDMGTMPAHP